MTTSPSLQPCTARATCEGSRKPRPSTPSSPPPGGAGGAVCVCPSLCCGASLVRSPDSVSMQSISVSPFGVAGRGWGRLSPLSLWLARRFSPLPMDRGTGDLWGQHFWSGKYMYCFVFFLNYGRESESPQQNRSPLSPRNVLHTLSLARRSRQGLPHPGQSPMCLVQEPSAPEMGPAEGTTATQQEGGPHPVPFAPPPSPLPPPLRLPGDEGVQLTSPPFLQQRSGVGPTRLLLLSPASPHLALSGPASLSRFSKDQKQANKKLKKKKKKVTKKSYKKRIKNFQRITIYFINLRIYYINIYSPSNISLPPLALIMKT